MDVYLMHTVCEFSFEIDYLHHQTETETEPNHDQCFLERLQKFLRRRQMPYATPFFKHMPLLLKGLLMCAVQERINGFHSTNHSHSLYGSEFADKKKCLFFLYSKTKSPKERLSLC